MRIIKLEDMVRVARSLARYVRGTIVLTVERENGSPVTVVSEGVPVTRATVVVGT